MEKSSKLSSGQVGDVRAIVLLRMQEMSSKLSLGQARVAPIVAFSRLKEISSKISLGQGGFVPAMILFLVSINAPRSISIVLSFPLGDLYMGN